MNVHLTMRLKTPWKSSGFTLVEMGMVMMITVLLMGGLIPTLSAQMESQRINETRKQMDEIKDALVGYATAKGRLPCPASSVSNGMESFCTTASGVLCTETLSLQAHGRCSSPYNGFVPAVTLGLTPVDSQGYMLDGWNNRIRYAVTNVNVANVYTFTAPGAMRSVGLSSLNSDLYVCASSPNPATPSQSVTASPWCGAVPPNVILTSTAPAVIYSTGTTGSYRGSGTDELANANPYANPTASPNSYEDKVFVSHDQTPTFDDIVVWLSPNILINRMVAAGQLP